MDSIRKYIYDQVASQRLDKNEAKKMLVELAERTSVNEPIAIIGMACRFPKARNLEEYWNNLVNGVNCIDIPSKSRREIWAPFFPEYFSDQLSEEEAFAAKGYIDEIDKFNPEFFKISAREARCMDPLHRLFLEVSYEAIEESGRCGRNMYGTKTGVFVGNDVPRSSLFGSIVDKNEDLVVTGLYNAILSSRISYMLNLKGKSLVIDTACSSGLVAVHEACQSLRNRDCDMALAGGIFLIDYIFKTDNDPMKMILSKTGQVRTFDKDAMGTLLGEGVGVVLLKPLSAALDDGDNIHAIIKGSAINNDGASNGITAPNADAQTDVIIKAWENAQINPESISFIEAHGTGTVLGDPIEVKAITNAFEKYTDKKQFCGIGSVKANIGHTVSASGMAALIKMVLALKNKVLPGNINFGQPNPYINFLESPVYVIDRLTEWDTASLPRRCGISSFGFSGTNCHVIIEESPEIKIDSRQDDSRMRLMVLSAKSESSLLELVSRYKKFLQSNKNLNVDDVCYVAGAGRGHYEYRIAILIKSVDDLRLSIEKLFNSRLKETYDNIYYGVHKIVPGNKKHRFRGEITEEERRELSDRGNILINEMNNHSTADYERILDEICKLYVAGAELDWDGMYANQKRRKISLPVYPFERISYWPNPASLHTSQQAYGLSSNGHPLLEHCLVESAYQDVYLTRFSIKKHWVLSEHNIEGKYIIPGTAYLEMAHKASMKYYRSGSVEFRDVIFIEPLFVEEEEEKEVHTILYKDRTPFEFVIVSKAENGFGEINWKRHAEGKICPGTATKRKQLDVGEISDRCKLNKDEPPGMVADNSFENSRFGRRWTDTLVDIIAGDNEILAKLRLPDNLGVDIEKYFLHPSLLDNAVNAAIRYIGNGIYLPFSYKSIVVHDSIPKEFYSYVTRTNKNIKNTETATFDISLINSESEVVLEISGYTIKKVNTGMSVLASATDSNITYNISWIPFELRNDRIMPGKGATLVFKGKDHFADEIVYELRNIGKRVIEVEIGEEYYSENGKYVIENSEDCYFELFEELKNAGIEQIIHTLSIDTSKPIDEVEELNSCLESGVYSLLRILKALSRSKMPFAIDLIIISRNSYKVTGRESRLNPHNAALIGLSKVVRFEYSSLKCRCIDTDESCTAAMIVKEALSDSKVFCTAYRDNIRYIEELETLNLVAAEDKRVGLKSDGVYIITGGAGGIGLEMALYLASQNKVNISLIGRSDLSLERNEYSAVDAKTAKLLKVVQEVEKMGSTISYHSADVSNEDDMRKVITSLRGKYGNINGIIHSAGVAGEGFIYAKSEQRLCEVLKPKVQGTFILDKLTKTDNMDFFILFSSVADLIGTPGQGDYIAANSYLDSFASYRNAEGRRTITINWPVWQETGMGLEYGVSDQKWIFKPLGTGNAVKLFHRILNKDVERVIIGEFDAGYEFSYNEDKLLIRLSDKIRLILEKASVRRAKERTEEQSRRDIILMGKVADDYTLTERKVAQVWCEALEMDRIDIYDDFYDLGGDSIIAMKIVNSINEYYGESIDVGSIFEHTSVHEFAAFLDGLAVKDEKCNCESTTAIESENIEYSLSHAQKRIWFLQKLEPELYAYNLSAKLFISGELDINAFKKAIEMTVQRHPALRTVFKEEGGIPRQVIMDTLDIELEFTDLLQQDDPMAIVNSLSNEDKKKAFDLTQRLFRIRLYRLKNEKYCVCIDIHHIITDGWSMDIIVNEIKAIYQSLLEGRSIVLKKLEKSYIEWIKLYEKWEGSDEFKETERYWLKELAKPLPVLNLPLDYKRPLRQTYNGSYFKFDLGKSVTEKVVETSKSLNCTMHIFLLSAYFALLYKLTHDNDIIVGIPMSGRNTKDFENVVGLFINSLCIRINFDDINTIRELLYKVKEKSLNAYKNSRYPFDLLVTKVNPERDFSRNPIFSTFFQLYDNIPPENEGISLFDLSLMCRKANDIIEFRFEYNNDLFMPETVQRFSKYFINVIEAFINDIDTELSRVQILSPDDKQQILYDFNNTRFEFNREMTIHEFFEKQAENFPERVAAIFYDKKITYGELNRKANQLARKLRENGVGRDKIVAIMVERSLEMMIGIIAILKAGGAYLPIDPDYPRSRIEFMLKDSGTDILLVQERFAGIADYNVYTMNIEDQEHYTGDDSNLCTINKSTDMVYVMYTSGSTGMPKGVIIEHHSLINKINWMQKKYPLYPNDVILQKTPFTFDVSACELFWWAYAGASISFLLPGGEKNPQEIINAVQESNVTVMHFVPSMLDTFLDFLDKAPDKDKVSSLKRIFASGEALSAQHVEKFNSILYNRFKIGLTNLYGPTEATIEVTYYDCLDNGRIEVVPIGKPIDNIRIYILDKYLELQPIGVTGELYISGEGVARGYLNRPDLTSEKFIDDPFFAGEKMYRTGDYARWLPNGDIEFLGRMDQQVKLRGFRIELGEIEQHLLQHESVRKAVVTYNKHANGTSFLCAYVVSSNNISAQELKAYLSSKLPQYMVPSYIVFIDDVPLTHSGKVDRKQLKDPSQEIGLNEEYRAPRDEIEEMLAEVWAEVLSLTRNQIGVNSSFFDLGGDSLTLVRMYSIIESKYPGKVGIMDIFNNPTISRLAEFIRSNVYDEKVVGDIGKDDFHKSMSNVFTQIDSGEMDIDTAIDILRKF